MSPYPARTGRQEIVKATCEIIEREGVAGLSLQDVADAVGVKTPSLYNHISGRKDLLRAVVERTFRGLFAAYQPALLAEGLSPEECLKRIFRLHREYAHAHPNAYTLAYSTRDPEMRADPVELEQQAIAVQQVMAQVSGEGQSLPALRGALALVHGFVTLELREQLQRGGDLGAAFEASVEAYLRGWRGES
jgi:AcrR family transcriptional regulator